MKRALEFTQASFGKGFTQRLVDHSLIFFFKHFTLCFIKQNVGFEDLEVSKLLTCGSAGSVVNAPGYKFVSM